jgi:hypothetical protein
MARAVPATLYLCEICKRAYQSEAAAKECETRSISEDKGVKVGDRVRVLRGDGVGVLATVESVIVYDREWGHYAWERYWHTIGLIARLDTWGHRQLTFDDYERA